MGLRGIGAKPIKKSTDEPKFKIVVQGKTRAQRVISFVQSLPITSGILAGRRFRLSPEQKQSIRQIYRTKRNGRRIVREVLLSFPRKNGKTTLTAALALCHLAGPEREQRGEIYSAANDRPQASIVFREMKAMILATDLKDRVIIRDWDKSLECVETGSRYTALSADVPTKHGFSASFWAYDEIAQAGHNRGLYDVLRTSGAARREPLGIVLSTMSPDPHSVMSELVAYARQEHTSEAFYSAIYSAPMDADWLDEQVWRDCNPGIAAGFRSIEEMRVAAEQAQRIPARESVFRLLYLNQPVEVDSRFISLQDWQACGADIDVEALRGRPCWAGLDLSSTQDLTALTLYFPENGGAVLLYCWIPFERMEQREHDDRVPYIEWHRQGLIETTPGKAIDRGFIVRKLGELAGQYDIKAVAFDRWRADDLQKMLDDEGVDLKLVAWGQGFKDMSPGVDLLETKILNRQLKHFNNPILTWNISNCAIVADPAGNRKIDKQRSREKVDAAVALTMALAIYAKEPEEKEITFGDHPMVIIA